jgi:hypothetical protein
MAKLTSARRNALPTKEFAGPHRSFPIPDKSHARNSLARAHFAEHPEAIRAKVHAKFPSIGKEHHDGSGLKHDHPMLHSDHFHMNRHRG